MAGVFMDELNNSNGNHDDDEVTQRVIPSRLPGPQARTQSVGSRNEDPVPPPPPNNLESQARTQSVSRRNEDPTLTWEQQEGDTGAVHVIEREHEQRRGPARVDA